MARMFAALLAFAMAFSCSARDNIEEEGETRRHLAKQWCEDWCSFLYDCDPIVGRTIAQCRETCEADEGWDHPGECGDIIWEYRECNTSMTCEEHLEAHEKEEQFPCQHLYNTYVTEGCT